MKKAERSDPPPRHMRRKKRTWMATRSLGQKLRTGSPPTSTGAPTWPLSSERPRTAGMHSPSRGRRRRQKLTGEMVSNANILRYLKKSLPMTHMVINLIHGHIETICYPSHKARSGFCPCHNWGRNTNIWMCREYLTVKTLRRLGSWTSFGKEICWIISIAYIYYTVKRLIFRGIVTF